MDILCEFVLFIDQLQPLQCHYTKKVLVFLWMEVLVFWQTH